VPDPCARCGATLPFDSQACPACQEPVHRLTAAEREKQRHGPRIAAVVTLVGIGVLVIFADVALVLAGGHFHRLHFYSLGLGLAFVGAGLATFRDL
jgi:hypothetical protein